MNKLLLIFSVLIVSCTSKPESKPEVVKDSNQAPSTDTTKVESHRTFNEVMTDLPEKISAFVPEGYSAIYLASGDANLDGVSDKILVLVKNTEAISSDYANDKPAKRPLILLLGQVDSTYREAKRNDNAVYCIDCGGMFGDPFTGVTIKNGYFSVEHGISGGRHWEQVTTFKYDKVEQNWFLYKDHYVNYKMNEDTSPDAEALVVEVDTLSTVKEFGVVPFEEYTIY